LEFGKRLGKSEFQALGFQANENPPRLKTHDRFGHRIDEVEFHPAWHELMRTSMAYGLHSAPWREPRPGAHVARAAKLFLTAQVECGHCCPITMTYGSLPSLRRQVELAAFWESKILSTTYDPRLLPADQKQGVLVGMAMTEKQGGSDVRANTTLAVPLGHGGPGKEYALTGHKWFCSAPMSDAFLVLAQASRGLSCFLLPRWTPDGKRNRFFIQRLKDKLGNRSNASSEIELDGTFAQLIGDEGRGVATIMEMGNYTRLDCALGSAAMMRQSLVQALHHTSHRSAFGKPLVQQPLMRNVLADLCLESEAATTLVMRLARAYDCQGETPREFAFRRIATAIAKYWVAKRAVSVVYEAMECHGGNGYVEESLLPRLYREAPVNAIWEGSSNIICLDVLRAMSREKETAEALVEEIRLAKGNNRELDAFTEKLSADVTSSPAESDCRHLVERMALALQGALLVRHGDAEVARAFCLSRLGGEGGQAFGTLPSGIDFARILERARPRI
jgi:putative acyl-CoA dehydrogenase